MPKLVIEKRSCDGLALEKRDGLSMPVVRGYAAVFNSVGDGGWFTEEVKPGAFSRSLKDGPDPRALVNHDSNLIIGRRSAGTLSLREDSKGLAVEIIPPDTSVGRDLVKSIERGDITGMSFAFSVKTDKWSTREGREHRELVDVSLYEVSAVVFPFYDATNVGIKSQDDAEARSSYEKWKASQAESLRTSPEQAKALARASQVRLASRS